MTLLSKKDNPSRMRQLGPDDWTGAALRLLVNQGVDAVQITALARDLDVTRGSFYWHFKGRGELLEALLAEWRVRNSGIMIDVLAQSESLEAGILDLFSVWVDHNRFDPNLDQAVRDWARRDEALAAALRDEDDARVAAIAAFFERFGFEPTEAFVRARVIYFTQLSYYSLGIDEPMHRRVRYLDAYFLCFTGTRIDASVSNAYRTLLLSEETA